MFLCLSVEDDGVDAAGGGVDDSKEEPDVIKAASRVFDERGGGGGRSTLDPFRCLVKGCGGMDACVEREGGLLAKIDGESVARGAVAAG